jgi:hypothetical protein
LPGPSSTRGSSFDASSTTEVASFVSGTCAGRGPHW